MHDRRLRAVWEDCFRPALTRPGFIRLIVLLTGWVLTEGPHAVTAALVATDVARRRHWAAFHRFFSRGKWSADALGKHVFGRVAAARAGTLHIVIDDTLAIKKGPKIFGLGNHLDAVRSTRRQKIFVFGHCWVVLAVLVRLPFSSRAWALPVLFRLYRNIKDCELRRIKHQKKTELAREMLDIVVRWSDGRRLEVAADGAYCNDTLSHDTPDNVVFFGSMRPDAVLTSLPTEQERRQTGRRRKRGALLRKPEKLARDGRTVWSIGHALLYGKLTRVRYKIVDAQWYRAMGTRLLRVVVVECTSGHLPIRVFFSSDPTLSPEAILETYAGRWGIEVFFRDAKQHLGFADSQARTEQAVLRTAPVVGLLYSTLVLWFADDTYSDAIAAPPIRPWYSQKRGLAFIDVLRSAQRALMNSDVLDPRSYSDDLRESAALRAPPDDSHRPRAA
jgi:hypothetical protein